MRPVNKILSFPEYIIDMIEDAYYSNEHKQKEAIMATHKKEHGIEPNQSYVLKYKKFRAAKFCLDNGDIVLNIKPTESLIIEIQKWLDSHVAFRYDMDKLKNFIAYLTRFSENKEFMARYIPEWFITNYGFRAPRFTLEATDKTDEVIQSKFKEEIQLIKRYFLLVKMKQME